MSYEIIWSPDAITSFNDRLLYLNIHWTQKEIEIFKNRVKEYLNLLAEEPFIGRHLGKSKRIYIGLILKQVSLIYRINKSEKYIDLVLFIDNRQDPKRIRKYKG